MKHLLVVGLGGFCGAIARSSLGGFVDKLVLQKLQRPLPAGTFVVNALGCLLIGALLTYIQSRDLSDSVRLFFVTGILGSLTTFSTFGYETIQLVQSRQLPMAVGNVAANLVVGLLFVCLGIWLAKLIG